MRANQKLTSAQIQAIKDIAATPRKWVAPCYRVRGWNANTGLALKSVGFVDVAVTHNHYVFQITLAGLKVASQLP